MSETLGEKYYQQVSESIQSIFELTTRVDERVQLLMKKQDQVENQFEQFGELGARVRVLEAASAVSDLTVLKDKVHSMELEISTLKNASDKQEGRWKSIFTFTIQIIWVLLASYLLYKLGIQSPNTP